MPSVDVQRALAAADLARYWRETGQTARPAPAPKPRAWRVVEPTPPTPSVPLRLGDVACSRTVWRDYEATCVNCGQEAPAGTRCAVCGGLAL